jgi:hypothetical protein
MNEILFFCGLPMKYVKEWRTQKTTQICLKATKYPIILVALRCTGRNMKLILFITSNGVRERYNFLIQETKVTLPEGDII